MFYLRVTQKVLNVSKGKAEAEPETIDPLKEWFANICSTSFKGKSVILFVHAQSKLAIIVKGKSILQCIDIFLERLELLLIRKGIDMEKRSKIIPDGFPMILKTNSKSVLGYMNEYKHTLDCWFYEYARYEDIDQNKMEDNLSDYVISVEKNTYDTPISLLRKLI